MRKDMLSIGEVARLKGIGIKALRYYERIGILQPAYVDEHTGYRYYTMHQMTEIDVIVSCVDLDIPLKELVNYRSEAGVLDISALLERGHRLAEQKLRKAQATLLMIDNYRTEIQVQEACRLKPQPYQRALTSGAALIVRWEQAAFDAKPYAKAMTTLYGYAKRCQLVPLFLQGMALFADTPQREGGWFAFLEVHNPGGAAEVPNDAGVEFALLPSGDYQGKRIVRDGFESCIETAFETATLLAASQLPAYALEVWDAELRSDQFVVELLHA